MAWRFDFGTYDLGTHFYRVSNDELFYGAYRTFTEAKRAAAKEASEEGHAWLEYAQQLRRTKKPEEADGEQWRP